ncbi:hypothetical protein BDB01DRAFT_804746 [Pilobolus umbonatus]|nr:hypothetical protein BDB01DRAFT_804746 [Pilobolus umbonatus]
MSRIQTNRLRAEEGVYLNVKRILKNKDIPEESPHINIVTNLCLGMLDSIFLNMKNCHKELRRTPTYSWDYVLQHAKQIGIPDDVIQRVQNKMEKGAPCKDVYLLFISK